MIGTKDTTAMSTQGIVVIQEAGDFGGTERHTAELVRHLLGEGWRVSLLETKRRLVSESLGDVAAIETVHTTLPLRGLSTHDVREWRRLLDGVGADTALFVKNWYFEADTSFLKVLRRSVRRVVNIEHSLPPELLAFRSLRRLGIIPCPGIWWYREAWRRWRMASLADHVITVSAAAKRRLTQHAFHNERHITVCPNGTDLALWRRDVTRGNCLRRSLGLSDDTFVFGALGSLVPLKGFDLAIRAFACALRRTHQKLAMVVAGDGPSRSDLQYCANEHGVEEHVHFLGRLQDPLPAYSAMNALLCTSTIESCPLAPLEAMACGCAVIAADVGDTAEMLREAPGCNVLPNRSTDAWARAMVALCEDAYITEPRMMQARRDFVAARYDASTRLEDLGHVIDAWAQRDLPRTPRSNAVERGRARRYLDGYPGAQRLT